MHFKRPGSTYLKLLTRAKRMRLRGMYIGKGRRGTGNSVFHIFHTV